MERDSLLPRSLFSASTLKVESVEETVETAARRSRSVTGSTPVSAPNNDMELDSDTSNSSVSSSENSDEETVIPFSRSDTLHINRNIQSLAIKLERQQQRQTRYLEKLKNLNKSIKKTSRLVGYHANLLAEASSTPSSSTTSPAKEIPQLAKRSAPFDTDPRVRQRSRFAVSLDRDEEAVDELDERQEIQDISNLTISNDNSTTSTHNPTASTQIRPPARPTPASKERRVPFPKVTSRPRPNNVEIEFGSINRIDTFVLRHKLEGVISQKKPRSLLYNIAEGTMDPGLNDLMIATTLDGDLQFWNTTERRMIKSIGKDHLYDSWIEDICWATPSTLAFCPSPKAVEPIKLVHIVRVTNSNVEGRIQTLSEFPHENHVSVIGSVDTGSYSSNSETCSFVTGGYDKNVFLWKLKRESPMDDFTTTSVSRLNIKHTSALYSFCHDKFRNVLFTGGSDERFSMYDMQANTSLRELRLTQRVSQIMQSKANPNIVLVTTTNRSDQFVIYDQRIPGFDGIKLRFGQIEQETLSRYMRPDFHENGYTVCCGGQGVPKLNFWDLRYTGVHRNPSFSVESHAKTRNLRTLFIPRHNSIVTLTSSRCMNWFDYSIKRDEIVKSLI